MRVKIHAHLECAPAAEGKTLLVKRTTRDIVRFQHVTGWKMAQLGEEIQAADVLAIPIAVYFALANAGFSPDWDELLSHDPDVFEPITEPGDDRTEAEADPQQLPADSSPAADGDEPAAAE